MTLKWRRVEAFRGLKVVEDKDVLPKRYTSNRHTREFRDNLAGAHIFIVEDDPRKRVIYQIIMVRHGVQAHFDKWDKNTIDKIKDFGEIDLIVLDLITTGGPDGFSILKAIRKDAALDDIPIVAVSAADPLTAISKAQELGFDGFIATINDDLFPEQLLRIMNGENVWHLGN